MTAASRACEPFLSDISLAASLAIEAHVHDVPAPDVLVTEEPAPVEPPPAQPSVEAESQAPIVTTPEPAPSDLRLALGLGALGAWGTTPDITGGAVLWAHARWTHFSMGLEARVDAPRSVAAGTGSVEAFVLFANAAGCAHLAPLAACVLAGGGVLRGAGSGLVNAAWVTAPYAVVGGSVQARIEIVPSFWFVARFDVLATLTRIVLVVDDVPAWTTEPSDSNGRRENQR